MESELGDTRIIGVYGYKVIEVKERHKVQGIRLKAD